MKIFVYSIVEKNTSTEQTFEKIFENQITVTSGYCCTPIYTTELIDSRSRDNVLPWTLLDRHQSVYCSFGNECLNYYD